MALRLLRRRMSCERGRRCDRFVVPDKIGNVAVVNLLLHQQEGLGRLPNDTNHDMSSVQARSYKSNESDLSSQNSAGYASRKQYKATYTQHNIPKSLALDGGSITPPQHQKRKRETITRSSLADD
jgi:hypothetical protein